MFTTAIKGKAEKVEFEVHPNIIQDLVHSQNGTVATSIRELVLNAIDASSPNVQIMIGTKDFVVKDQGRGFSSKKEVMDYFKTFGTPHEEGDATYARFRIGRGQVMSLAKVNWTSGSFSMSVDVRKYGLSFSFKEFEVSQCEGCKVSGTFYEKLHSYDLRIIQEELEKHIKYAPCKVSLNGQVLNADPETEPWDIEDDQVKIRWTRTDGIQIYSKGIYVKSLPAYQYGFRAVVLTKDNLVLNMARNEINTQDSLWIKIKNHLKNRAKEVAKLRGKGGKVSAEVRRSMIRMFLSGDMDPNDIFDVTLLKNCTGRSHSLRTVFSSKNLPVSVSPEQNSRIAETITRQGRAHVFDPETLEEFKVNTIEELIEKILDALLLYRDATNRIDYWVKSISGKEKIAFDVLASTVLSDISLIQPPKYTPRQRAARNALQHGARLMARELTKILGRDVSNRKILLGKGCAMAWTNGFDMIAFSIDTIKFLDTQGRGGGMQLALILLHEYLHDTNDEDGHDHSTEFMDHYHDLSSNPHNGLMSTVATGLYNKYLSELANNCQDLPPKAKGEILYLRDTIQHIITVKPSGFSDFDKLILKEMIKIPIIKRKGKFILTQGSSKAKRFKSGHWYRFAKKQGADVLDFDTYCDGVQAKDVLDEHRMYAAHLSQKLYSHFADRGLDQNFFERLIKTHWTSETLIVLSSAPNSGISYFERNSYEIAKHIRSAKVDYDHCIYGPFPGQHWGDDRFLQTHTKHEGFAGTQNGRLNYAKHIVAHAFMGLKDPKERNMLAKLINDESFDFLIDTSNRFIEG